MANPYIGEIRMFAGDFAPQGWKFCDGQLLLIAENDALYQLIKTAYGGDGQTTFALPDLRGRIPVHQGPGHPLAEAKGTETVAITVDQMPGHTHRMQGTSDPANPLSSPAGSLLADTGVGNIYDPTFSVRMSADAISKNAGDGAHDNMAPYLCVSCIIFGNFPSPSPV